MDDEQIKEDPVEMEGNDKDDDQAYWRGIVCNTSNVKVILTNMTKVQDFAKGTKALESKVIITRDQNDGNDVAKEQCVSESQKEKLKTRDTAASHRRHKS